MGIYDREYIRSDRRTYLGSFSDSAPVCKWLIGINVLVFFLQLFTQVPNPNNPAFSASIVDELFTLNTQKVMHGQVWQLLSYAFLHAGIWHILFNMLFLWWFGHQLESNYGSREFLAFYLVAAVLGGIAFTAQAVFTDQPGRCIGASGAVVAVMLFYACHYPHRRIYLFFVIPVPIWGFVAYMVITDLMGYYHSVKGVDGQQAPVAYGVHLAGAAFGFLYFRFQWRIMPLLDVFRFRTPQRRRQPRLRVYQEPRETVSVASRSSVDEQFEAKVDAVLEKIKTHGQDSLSENEREILQKASEFYKQRRS